MALYDLAAKHAEVPLYRYLGGRVRDIVTDITVGIGEPKEMAVKALAFQEQGAAVLKVKLGKRPAEDIERIRAIRALVGDLLPIRIDANQGWSYEEAAIALRGLQPFHIQFCEEPMRSYNDNLLPQLRQAPTIPNRKS